MSSSNLRPLISEDAEAELNNILLYTEQEWGSDQRSDYGKLIWNTIIVLTANPSLGRSRDELSEGLRSYPVGRHVLYYWLTDTTLTVAHILHSRQDPFREDWAQSPTAE